MENLGECEPGGLTLLMVIRMLRSSAFDGLCGLGGDGDLDLDLLRLLYLPGDLIFSLISFCFNKNAKLI